MARKRSKRRGEAVRRKVGRRAGGGEEWRYGEDREKRERERGMGKECKRKKKKFRVSILVEEQQEGEHSSVQYS